MSELTLHQLLRLRHVKRWHIVHVARDQTVAEHSWAVAIIARHLCDRLKTKFNAEIMLMLTEWALLHDTPESITGDLPSPMATRLGEELRAVEQSVSQQWKVYQNWSYSAADGLPAHIVKMADLIEAISFLDDDAIGEHANRVKRWIVEALNKQISHAEKEYPQFEWHNVVLGVLGSAIIIEGEGHD